MTKLKLSTVWISWIVARILDFAKLLSSTFLTFRAAKVATTTGVPFINKTDIEVLMSHRSSISNALGRRKVLSIGLRPVANTNKEFGRSN